MVESYIVNIILVCMPVIFINVFLAATERSNNLLYVIHDQRNTTRYDIFNGGKGGGGDLFIFKIIYVNRYLYGVEERDVIKLYFDNLYLRTAAKDKNCKYECTNLF